MATSCEDCRTGEIVIGLEKLNLKIEDVISNDDHSRCEGCLFLPYGGQGKKLLFCSERCTYNFWVEVKQIHLNKSGKHICTLSGCTNVCLTTDGRILDHCNSLHENCNVSLLHNMYGGAIDMNKKVCKLPQCQKLCYVEDTGRVLDHCGKRHAKMHKQMTTICMKCPQMKSPILFYNSSDPYYEFSNFYEFAPFELDRKKWKSSEHYFQAQKFIGTPYEELIRVRADTPRNAFEMARLPSRMQWLRSDWDKVKLYVMYKALLAKFFAHDRLRLLLFSTGNRKLVEHTLHDDYWGDGGHPKYGKNYLGKLLEDVRLVLHGKESKTLK